VEDHFLLHGHVSDRRGKSLRIQDGRKLKEGERRVCVYAQEQSLCLVVYAAKPVTVCVEAFASGDAPIFVKGRQENPESSIVGGNGFFAAGPFGCETYIAGCSLGMGNKESLEPCFLSTSKKDGSHQQCTMQCSWHIPYDDRCSHSDFHQASGRRGPGNLLWHF
jgi:hypothetical protein